MAGISTEYRACENIAASLSKGFFWDFWWLQTNKGKCNEMDKKFELMLTRHAKAYSSSGSVV